MAGDSDIFPDPSPRSISGKERYIVIATFVVLIASIAIFAALQYHRIVVGAQTLLNSVSTQKVEQILQWRMRHLLEADETGQAGEIIELVDTLAQGDSEKAQTSLHSWFENFRRIYGYMGSLVLRPNRDIALATSDKLGLDATALGYFDEAVESGKAVMTDLHYLSPSGKPGCNIIIPIFADRVSKPRLAGYIVHFIDAENDLFPIIQSWPVPSETAEKLHHPQRPGPSHRSQQSQAYAECRSCLLFFRRCTAYSGNTRREWRPRISLREKLP